MALGAEARDHEVSSCSWRGFALLPGANSWWKPPIAASWERRCIMWLPPWPNSLRSGKKKATELLPYLDQNYLDCPSINNRSYPHSSLLPRRSARSQLLALSPTETMRTMACTSNCHAAERPFSHMVSPGQSLLPLFYVILVYTS